MAAIIGWTGALSSHDMIKPPLTPLIVRGGGRTVRAGASSPHLPLAGRAELTRSRGTGRDGPGPGAHKRDRCLPHRHGDPAERATTNTVRRGIKQAEVGNTSRVSVWGGRGPGCACDEGRVGRQRRIEGGAGPSPPPSRTFSCQMSRTTESKVFGRPRREDAAFPSRGSSFNR